MRYLAVAFLIILLGVNLVVFDVQYYKNNGNCDDKCGDIVKYFLYLNELEGDYTDEELEHMQDVRKLILFEFLIMLALVGFVVFAKRKDFLYGGIISFALISIFMIFAFFSFGDGFVVFHDIFFDEGTWIFPQDSMLITMFSEDFFYGATVRIILYTSVLSLLAILGGIVKWKKRK